MLRLGHRPERDKRITTHVGLVARAFGADGILIANAKDEKVVASLRKVCSTWGNRGFIVADGVDSIRYIKGWKSRGGIVVHLTMYGINVDEVISEIRTLNRDILIIVGAEKVPRIYYELADYNVAIGNQPHSEVSALAIFLDRYYGGSELYFIYPDAKLRIEPSERNKKVVKIRE